MWLTVGFMTMTEAEAIVARVPAIELAELGLIAERWPIEDISPKRVLELAEQMRPSELLAWLEEGRRKVGRQRRPRG